MKYYIIAGEASGDLHASNLMKEIMSLDTKAKFRVWGGDRMKAEGAEVVKHYRDLAFMGFVEVAANIRTITRNIRFCKEDILEYQPDAIILVDYPGFNLRIAEFAHKKAFKVFYYVSPQVWAWKKGRVKTIRRVVDKMMVILPFEKDFYQQYGYEVDFVGHPLLDAIADYSFLDRQDFIRQNKLDGRPIIALLPGSRRQEISKMLKVMLKMVPIFRDYQFVIAAAPSVDQSFYDRITRDSDVKFLESQTYNLLNNAEAACVTSGTATLETALMEIPEVVCYKGNPISYQIARRIVDVKYISLVNLIADKPLLTELIQNRLNVRNLKNELKTLLFDNEKRQYLKSEYKMLKEKLGGEGASANAARIITENI
ncbi:MAG: lipid-A-disaccharide synthase [Bacteroidales bacterium]|nr:lipid-A-disaccharide synthase [Bacteroidales bacterium]